MTATVLTVESLNEAELQSLDLAQQATLLNHIMARLRDHRVAVEKAIDAESRARQALLFDRENPQLRATEIAAKAQRAILNERVKTLKDWKSALQSLIRPQ